MAFSTQHILNHKLYIVHCLLLTFHCRLYNTFQLDNTMSSVLAADRSQRKANWIYGFVGGKEHKYVQTRVVKYYSRYFSLGVNRVKKAIFI